MLDVASALSTGMGVAPLFVIIIIYKTISPKYHGMWMFGALLILLAGLLAGALNILDAFIQAQLAKGATELALEEAKASVKIWVYIGPAVIAAIGANLITAFILKDKAEINKQIG